MMKVSKLFNWRIVGLISLVLIVCMYLTMAGTNTKVFVNGVQISTKTFEKYGQTYVSLEAVVKKLGGVYTWDASSQSATVKVNGKTFNLVNNNSSVKKGGKWVPLTQEEIDEQKIPGNVKAIMVNKVMYVPLSFIGNYIETVTVNGSNIYIGKVLQESEFKPTPTPTPQPKPEPTPAPKGTFGKEVVINKLASNGFYKFTGDLATFNPFAPGAPGYEMIIVGFLSEHDMYMKIYAWYDNTGEIPEANLIPGKVKYVLEQTIPSGASKIFEIVDYVAVHGTHKEMNKVFTYDGLKVNVTFNGGSKPYVEVSISK